jgi:hypothetical protein
MTVILNDINSVCDAVEAAIKAILGPDVDVQEARHPSLTFAVNLRGQGVVWSYGRYQKQGEGPLGDLGKQDFSLPFTVCVIGMDWSSPGGANREARQMAETLRGSPSQAQLPINDRDPNLRLWPLGTLGGQPITLQFLSERAELDPKSTPTAGRVAYIQDWSTFPSVRM